MRYPFRRKKNLAWLFPALLSAGIFLYFWLWPGGTAQIKPGFSPTISGEQNQSIDQNQSSIKNQSIIENQPTELVSRVIDGDTIELANGEKVRYIGVNTPELSNRNSKIRSLAYSAKDKNFELVEGKEIILVKDISERDKYGRLLRYVYLTDGTFVNLELVREGYAYASAYPPDVAHQAEFEQAQSEARSQKIGLWQ